MPRPTAEVIAILTETADRLEAPSSYQWGHMGECNCGHLVQTITGLGSGEIHRTAMEREGDWEEQARSYCASSGLLIDTILASLLAAGFTLDDVRDLEKLSNDDVLAALPDGRRWLQRNRREDVVLYLRTWAALLCSEASRRRESAVRA